MLSFITIFLRSFVICITSKFLKNPENRTFIDLMLTNSYRSFHKSCTLEMANVRFPVRWLSLSWSHTFIKKIWNITKYRDYSNFCNEKYRQRILKEMSNWAQNNSNNYDKFLKICKDVLDGRAPVKRRYLRLIIVNL